MSMETFLNIRGMGKELKEKKGGNRLQLDDRPLWIAMFRMLPPSITV